MSKKEDSELNVNVSGLNLIACAIAAGISYAINKSVWWALLHFFLGWIYLAYQFALMYLVE